METYTLAYPTSQEYWDTVFKPDMSSPLRHAGRLLVQPPLQRSELDYLTPEQATTYLAQASSSLTRTKFDDSIASSRTLAQLTTPVHVLVASHAQKRKLENAICHVCAQSLPPESLVFADGSRVYGASARIACASPELSFLQAAVTMQFAELLRLGYSICGYYVFNNSNARGFDDRIPLTTPERLCEYLAKAQGLHGRTAALRAAKLVLPRSASPMETVVVVLLVLPRRFGGNGLPVPELNYRIDIPPRWQDAFENDYVIVDACWPLQKVVFEFNGSEWHTGRENMALDTDRINLLQAMGYTVVPLMYPQVKNEDKFDAAVHTLCKALKIRYRPLTDKQLYLRRELMDALMP